MATTAAKKLRELQTRVSHEYAVVILVGLLRRCDRLGLVFEDCLDEAEARFVAEVDPALHGTEEARHAGEGLPGDGPQES